MQIDTNIHNNGCTNPKFGHDQCTAKCAKVKYAHNEHTSSEQRGMHIMNALLVHKSMHIINALLVCKTEVLHMMNALLVCRIEVCHD